MKVYRGPQSKDFSDDSHELVDSVDLSKEVESWTSTKIITANITKEGIERQSVATMMIDEGDVLALYASLIKGWQEKLENYEKIIGKLATQKNALLRIQNIVKWHTHSGTNAETFKTILEIVDGTLQTKE